MRKQLRKKAPFATDERGVERVLRRGYLTQQPGRGGQPVVPDWQLLAGQALVTGQLLRAAILAWGAVPAASTEPASSKAPALRAISFSFMGNRKKKRVEKSRTGRCGGKYGNAGWDRNTSRNRGESDEAGRLRQRGQIRSSRPEPGQVQAGKFFFE